MNKRTKQLAIKWLFELIIPAIIMYIAVILAAETDSWYFILIVLCGLILSLFMRSVYYEYFKEDETEQDKD